MLCVGFLIVFSCQAIEAPQASLSFCGGVRPIFWSKNDTRRTKEQVDVLNRKWKKFCRG